MKKEKKFEGNTNNYKPIDRKIKALTDQQYILQRLDDQINWHKNKSEFNNSKFVRLRNIDTVIAAVVPLSIGIGSVFDVESEATKHLVVWVTRIASALSGVYLAISAGFFELEGYEVNARNYKKMYKKLEAEKYKYLSRTEPYDEEDAFARLVFAVENELNRDVDNFFKSNKNLSETKKTST